MAKVQNPPKIMYHTVLLLVGILLCSFYILFPNHNYPSQLVRYPEEYEFTLSEESPIFRYNITHFQVGISHVQTNNTQVSIVARDMTQVIFNSTNIISLSEYYIEIQQSGLTNDWWLEVIRQDSDANVSITIHYWFYVAPLVLAAPRPIWALLFGVALSIFAIYKLLYTYIGPDNQKKVVTAFLLIIIGSLCCYPLLLGNSNRDFSPVSTSVSLPDENYSFTLNGTHPNSSIDLSTLYPEEGSRIYFKIHSINSTEYPFLIYIAMDDMYELVLEQDSQNSDWWISIPTELNSPIILGLGRVSTDLEVAISVKTTYQSRVSGENIVIPAILGILGVSTIIVGIYFSIRADKGYDTEESQYLGNSI